MSNLELAISLINKVKSTNKTVKFNRINDTLNWLEESGSYTYPSCQILNDIQKHHFLYPISQNLIEVNKYNYELYSILINALKAIEKNKIDFCEAIIKHNGLIDENGTNNPVETVINYLKKKINYYEVSLPNIYILRNNDKHIDSDNKDFENIAKKWFSLKSTTSVNFFDTVISILNKNSFEFLKGNDYYRHENLKIVLPKSSYSKLVNFLSQGVSLHSQEDFKKLMDNQTPLSPIELNIEYIELCRIIEILMRDLRIIRIERETLYKWLVDNKFHLISKNKITNVKIPYLKKRFKDVNKTHEKYQYLLNEINNALKNDSSTN